MPTSSAFSEQKSNSISQKDEDISTENECTHESLFKQDNLANCFYIIGDSQKHCHDDLLETRYYNEFKEIRQTGEFTGSSGAKTNGNPNLLGKPSHGNYFVKDGELPIHSLYNRVFIRERPNLSTKQIERRNKK